jgi:hypothetical protein
VNRSAEALTHFETVRLLSAYIDYRPHQGWDERKNRSQLVDIEIMNAKRRLTTPGRQTVNIQVMGIHDIYGGISYMVWQRHGTSEAPRAYPDIADIRKDFPQIPVTDNAIAKLEITKLLKDKTIKVYRRTSTNASTGFVYVLDWKSREGSPSGSNPLVRAASASPQQTSTGNIANARRSSSSSLGRKRQDRKQSPSLLTGTSAGVGALPNAGLTRQLPGQPGQSVM